MGNVCKKISNFEQCFDQHCLILKDNNFDYYDIDDIIKSCKQSEIRSRERNACRFRHFLSMYIEKLEQIRFLQYC